MNLTNLVLLVVAGLLAAAAIFSSSSVMSTRSSAAISAVDESGKRVSFALPESLSKRQRQVLSLAAEIARNHGTNPQLLQGILLQESHAGDLRSYKVAGQEFGLRTNERYYGVAQIKLMTARHVLSEYPSLRKQFQFQTNTDEELLAKLIENDEFNITVASRYLSILKTLGYSSLSELAVAYNRGPTGAKGVDASSHAYSVGVTTKLKQMKTI